MSLKEKIETNYKNSLKAKNKTEISTYRLILSSIKDLDIVNRSGPDKKETDDEDIKKLLKKMIKQRTESIEIYKKNDRKDLLEVEQNEFELLTSFLPKQIERVYVWTPVTKRDRMPSPAWSNKLRTNYNKNPQKKKIHDMKW